MRELEKAAGSFHSLLGLALLLFIPFSGMLKRGVLFDNTIHGLQTCEHYQMIKQAGPEFSFTFS